MDRKQVAFFVAVLLLVGMVFVFSQQGTCLGDEGFHLLAAQLVMSGKRPYIDFFYQHPPLYIYITAGWMSVFGDTWRSAHALSALLTGGCIALVATYLYNTWRGQAAGLAVSLTATLLLALNYSFVGFGTIGQPYAFCLFFSVAAFRLTIKARQSPGLFLSGLAGLFAGAATASSFLALPVGPVLLGWLLWHSHTGDRLRKAVVFSCGALLPFLPLLVLFVRSPRQVVLDVFQYQLFYRDPGSTEHSFLSNLKILLRLIADTPGPLLLLAALGCTRLLKNKDFSDAGRMAEFQLCSLLVVSLGVYLTLPMPTFAPYYVLLVPFIVVLASSGIHMLIASPSLGRMRWLLLSIIILTGANLREVYGGIRGASACWQTLENNAMTINSVTPAEGVLYADEALYFLSKRVPPPGLENSFGMANLPSELAPLARVASSSQIDQWLTSSYFDSVIIAVDDPKIEKFDLLHAYPRNQKMNIHNSAYYLLWKK